MTRFGRLMIVLIAVVSLAGFAVPAQAQVVVRLGHRRHYHRHYYHHHYHHHWR